MGNLGPFDSLLQLRDIGDASETSTAAETGIALDVLRCDHFDVVIDIGTLDDTSVFRPEA